MVNIKINYKMNRKILAFLVISIFMFSLFMLKLAKAYDYAPKITLSEISHNPIFSQSTLLANGIDIDDNAGLIKIWLYEDGALYSEKDCAGFSTCALQTIVTHNTAGWHSFYARTKDKSGKTATSETLRIYFEGSNQPPQITSKSPSQDTFSVSEAVLQQSFVVIASDPNGDTLSYTWYVNNQQQSASGNSFLLQLPNVNDAQVFDIAVIVSDGRGNTASAGWRVTIIDTVPENIDFSFSPSSPSIGQVVSFIASGTAFDAPLTFSWDFGDGGIANGQSVSHAYNMPGTYDVVLTARDADGDERSTTKQIIVGDINAPSVIIISPEDGQTYASLPIPLNYIVSDDDGIAACWYVLNGGAPQNLPGCQNTTLTLANSAYTLFIYAQDVSNNVGSASVSFNISVQDTQAPSIIIVSPENITYTVSDILINISASDNVAIDQVWYSIDGGVNITYTNSILQTFAQGMHVIEAWANDTSGNLASASVAFTVLLPPPAIIINEFESNNGTPSGDWIELYNPTANDVNVTGWYIRDAAGNVLPLNQIINAGSYLIRSASNLLNNGGENITLYDNFNQIVDDVSYNLADTLGNDLCWARVPNGQDTNTLSDWQFQQCTRGFSNDLQLGVILESDSYARTVSKNANATYIINITNTGNVWNNFVLGVINYNGANVWLNESSIILGAGESKLVQLDVSSSIPGSYVVRVYANSTINAGLYNETQDITTTVINNAPIANDDYYEILEDESLSIPAPGVLANDNDTDGDTLTAILVSSVSNGNLIFNSDGSFIYTPDPNFNGIDSFSYIVSDGMDNSSVATVTINVSPVNDAPLANDDTYSVNENDILTISAPGVLANDSDVDGDTLTAVLVNSVSHGNLVLNANGSFIYIPEPDWYGIDSFRYIANDGANISNIATVTVIVNPINDAPTTPPSLIVEPTPAYKSSTLIANATGSIDVDGDIITYYYEFRNNATGVILQTWSTNNTFDCLTSAGCNKNDDVLVIAGAFDGIEFSGNITVVKDIKNTPPVIQNDVYNTNEDNILTVPTAQGLLVNDSDIDIDILSAILVTNVSNGVLTLNSDGSFTYIPNANFNGIDSFTYVANDGEANSNIATVTINVVPVNDAPYLITLIPDVTFDEDSYNDSLDMTNYFADVDNATLVYSFTSNNSNVIVTFVGTRVNITANPNWNGIAEVTLIASDGEYSANDTIIVTVNPVPDYGVSITATPSSQTVGLLEPAIYTINITNIGDTQDNFNLTIQNINNADQAILNETTTPMLNQGGSYIVSLTVSDSNPGVYIVNVIATSNSNTSISNITSTTTSVVTLDTGWIFNSTVNGTFYVSQSTGIFNNINDSIIKNFSTIKASAGGNFNEDILILDSNIDNSTVENSWLTAVNATASIINNSILNNCTVINATVKGIIASNCYLADGIYDPPQPTNNLTGSNLTNSHTYQSNVTYSNVSYSNITYSNVDKAIINESNITYSNISNSTIESSNLDYSNISDSIVANSMLINSTVENSEIENSTLTNSTTNNSTITNSMLNDSNVTNSTINNSSLNNSTVINSDLENITATNTIITNSTLGNATLIDANVTDNVLYNGTIITTNFTYNATNNTPLNLSNSSALPSVRIVITSPSPYYEDESISFNALIGGQFNTNDNITYEWDWTNDGTFDYSAINVSTATHTYNNPGRYIAKVKVTDVHGTSAWSTISFRVVQKIVEERGGGGREALVAPICGNNICEGNESVYCPQDCKIIPNLTVTTTPKPKVKAIEIKSDDRLVIVRLLSSIEVVNNNNNKIDPNTIKIEKITDLTLLPTLPQDVYLVRAYKFTPAVRFGEDVELIIKINEEFAEGANLFIYNYEGGGWRKIESVWDKENGKVVALVDSAAIIGLFVDRLPIIPVTGGVIGWLKSNWHIAIIALLGLIIVILAVAIIVKKVRH
ncbi:MAG: tandem-95 repeat protein [Candidatus Pacearchaeota archaeon]